MKSTRRIGLLLTLVFLLPALFFSVYELSTLNKDEKMIQDIYARQLEAILFSVNQYADDVVGNWISRSETSLEDPLPADSLPQRIADLLDLNPSLRGVFVIDTLDGRPVPVIFASDTGRMPWQETENAIVKNQELIARLVDYKRNGFQKLERLGLEGNSLAGIHCLVYIATDHGKPRIAGLYIDPVLFMEDIIGPRLQTIARDQFILSVMARDTVVYTTETLPGVATQAEAVTRKLWIFPDYAVGIRTSGDTLQQLVRERTRTNFILLAALDAILILAVVLVFRNLKKEVDLAQNKTEFVSNVSHEIRTPLALISMFAETLEMDRVPSEEKKREYYRIISKETQRLTGIVNKILNFSQAEAKKKTLHIEPLELGAEVRSILETYDFHLRNKGFDYAVEGPDDIRIMADREALVESVVNLVDNAMKYSEEKKYIAIGTGVEDGYGFVSVKDQGVGISKAEQKHIFDKFYRVPGGNLARSRGTGLGLSLVKQLMEDQGGKVTVSSEPGAGSTFTLYFPRKN